MYTKVRKSGKYGQVANIAIGYVNNYYSKYFSYNYNN